MTTLDIPPPPHEAPTDHAGHAIPARAHPHRVDSAVLFGPLRELIIVHNGREYRLRLTQYGKLILTA
jgi:hemin uptake protein HemP